MISLLLCILVLATGGTAVNGAERTKFGLMGLVLQADETPFPRQISPVVFLQGAATPFSAHTEANFDGRFRFKDLAPGTYILVVEVPNAGELRKSVEVGPSLADEKGNIAVRLVFDRSIAAIVRNHDVSAAELSVSDDAWNQYEKAHQRLEKHDVEGAVILLKRAVEIAPQFAKAWNQLGTIAYQTRRMNDAEGYFREALKQDETAYPPLVNLGGTLLTLNRPEEALPLNQSAVKRRPDDALAHVQLGRNYLAIGRPEDAERHLRAAKAIDPAHFSLPQLTLVEIYGARHDYAGVIRELEEFLKYHPDSPSSPAVRKSLELNMQQQRTH
jgi:tetratricopeptide (TPR) repeat protein